MSKNKERKIVNKKKKNPIQANLQCLEERQVIKKPHFEITQEIIVNIPVDIWKETNQ